MSAQKIFLTVLFISAVVAPAVFALKCYECTGQGDRPEDDCHHSEKLTKDESKLRECNGKHDLTQSDQQQTQQLINKVGQDKVTFKCYKRVITPQGTEGKATTKRGCKAVEKSSSGECHGLTDEEKQKMGNSANNMEYNTCECGDKDGCNSAEGRAPPTFLVALAIGVLGKVLV